MDNKNNEIYHSKSCSLRLAFSGGELKTKETDSSSAYAVRVLDGEKLGFAYCQQESELDRALEEAKTISRFAPKSRFSFAPKTGKDKYSDGLSDLISNIYDPALNADDYDLVKSLVVEAKDVAGSKGGRCRVIAWLDNSHVRIENSAGFVGEYDKSTISIYTECMHGDGFGYSNIVANHVPKDVSQRGLEAAEMALAMQHAGKPESGAYTVVFELDALASLIETLIPSFSGDWKRRKITKLSSGQKSFSNTLTICDDGLAKGISARPFDDEGTPSQKLVLVENGTVKSFLYDRETAALESVAPDVASEGEYQSEAGACYRESVTSPPSISPSNIVVSPGDVKDLSELGKFIDVHYAHGSHTANLTTGDIGLEVGAAFLFGSGGERKPLKGFMLSANVFDLFANIEAIESKQQYYGSLISPRIAFRNVRVVS